MKAHRNMHGSALLARPFQPPKQDGAGQQRQYNMKRAADQDAECRQTSVAPIHGDNGCCWLAHHYAPEQKNWSRQSKGCYHDF